MDADGNVIARKSVVDTGGVEIEVWSPTPAWPESTYSWDLAPSEDWQSANERPTLPDLTGTNETP